MENEGLNNLKKSIDVIEKVSERKSERRG